ncbi:MAG TPA: 3' terminal RNA ribose 2'-O-methyltransferase Hen1, partial [Planctomycetaceae bacterium]|nr:3' terminal RNA ribose 2'-O-methyltransferase Hen1 [Planctomycetaceae bacterium]
MLLTITTTKPSASDLGYLLHKHPDRFQSFDLSFGRAHVFYPEMAEDRCTACLMLDVDPVGMVRRKHPNQSFLLGHYVNDRPYVASSLLSVAISQVFGTALSGRCKDRPELVNTPIPLVARIETLPVRGGEDFLQRVFQPLGYAVEATRHPLDSQFPEWGESPYFSVTLAGTKTLSELLTHLYVLIPVFDNEKHYFVGEDELEKLLVKGAGWLASHPEKEQITRRYLKHRSPLYREALARLADVEETTVEPDEEAVEKPEDLLEQPLCLNQERHGAVLAVLRASGARSVLDLGCSEGKLLQELLKDRQFERILGMDVSVQALERAARRLAYDRLPPK